MKNILSPIRLIFGLLLLVQPLLAQTALQGEQIRKIYVQPVGPPAVSEAFIRANIRSKEGDRLFHATIVEDQQSLYATGFFFNVQITETNTPEGVDLCYLVQGNPIVTDIRIVGNKKLSLNKLKKKLTSKIGQPLDKVKLFHDAQAMQELYQKAGYQDTTVKVLPYAIDEAAGRASVTIEVKETEKVRVVDIVFDGAQAKTQKALRKVLKTRRHWMFSWLTGSGVLKQDEFTDDMQRLTEFYQNDGYVDFSIQDRKFQYLAPNRMIIHIVISEGRQYKVGAVTFTGNTLFSTNDFIKGKVIGGKLMILTNAPGAIFKPDAFSSDVETIQDMYGSKGYLGGQDNGSTFVTAERNANTATGTIDIAYTIKEGDKSYIERVEIKGNEKTKDKVIRRELQVYPGEVYNMVNVKITKQILEQMDYFSKVDINTEDTGIANYKDLVIGLQEESMSSASIGAGFSSVESIVGFVEVKMKNFDLFNPPTFTGAGQKLQLIASIGSLYQDYELSFIEPYFLDQRLALGVNLFHKDVYYDSLNNEYDEFYDGGTVSLTKALLRNLKGTVSYTIEDAHVSIVSGYNPNSITNLVSAGGLGGATNAVTGHNISTNIYDEHGSYLINQFGATLDYDTRTDLRLPDHGQHTELITQIATPPGNTDFYKIEMRSSWFFKGFFPGHILQLDARSGVVDGYDGSGHVPIFERWFLGGLGSLRGYRYRQVGPEDIYGEPLGGDTYFFADAEYSIPLNKIIRLAWFYDMGNVFAKPYSLDLTQAQTRIFSDDVGMGLRITLPIGGPQGIPLRVDYGIPLTHDPNLGGGGKVQIGIGYTRDF